MKARRNDKKKTTYMAVCPTVDPLRAAQRTEDVTVSVSNRLERNDSNEANNNQQMGQRIKRESKTTME